MLVFWVSVTGVIKARRTFIQIGWESSIGMATALGIGLAGYMAAAMFIHTSYPRFLWLIIGIALSLPRVAENELAFYKLKLRDEFLDEI